jgi:hypothetical protein
MRVVAIVVWSATRRDGVRAASASRCASEFLALNYMERVLGYGPRVAQERLRVARALGDLPEMTDELARGELSFSAVRELPRVATRGTEAEWIVAAREMNLREIEELVAGHRPGDLPEDPPDPDVRTHVLQLELKPETYALLRQARARLEEEHGRHLDDDAFVAALAASVLDGESNGRARYEIAVTRAAVEEATRALEPTAPLEELIREALRRCR